MPDSPVDPPGRASPRVVTGISGLDDVLGGEFPSNRMHLIQGSPGTGKTTWGGQFLLNGVSRGEKVLFTTLTNTLDKLLALADSHRWSLEGINIFELSAVEGPTVIGQPLKHRRHALLSPDKACFPRFKNQLISLGIASHRLQKAVSRR
jgi:predicted ATP-dependent serine protease